MIDNIDVIVREAVGMLYHYDGLGLNRFAPARVADYVRGLSSIDAIKAVLSQVSLAVSLVFGAVLVYVMIKRRTLAPGAAVSAALSEAAAPSMQVPAALRGRWNEIITHLDSARENDWKLAVLEADKLVDSALMRAGFAGDTFGDRLTNIQTGDLISLDGLWWAHKVRNRVAHELDYFLRYTEARQAVSYYEAALAELKFI